MQRSNKISLAICNVMPAWIAGIQVTGMLYGLLHPWQLDSCRAVLPGTLRAGANPLLSNWSGNPCRGRLCRKDAPYRVNFAAA
jgi:hypothetical protein